jgi:8-oxo-dGTP pyrophosphatase MutT (NUDIX family)
MHEQVTPTAAPAAPPYPALGVGAKAIIVDRDGAVLVIRRRAESHFAPGTWDLPGGKMDDRERLVDALAREVFEETGLRVRAEDAVPFHVSHFVKEPFWVTCVTFVCPDFEGAEVRLSAEHTEYAWLRPGEYHDRPYADAIEEQLDAWAGRQ